MSRMEEVLRQANEVKPLSEVDGTKVVSYEDASILQQQAMIKDKLGEDVDLGDVEVNPDGTIARSRASVIAINEDKRLANRYRVIGKKGGGKLLQVVTDYRAVKEHGTGKVYLARIPAYEFERDENGKLVMLRQTTVEAGDFISKFAESLNNEAMYEVLKAITDNEENATKSEMPI